MHKYLLLLGLAAFTVATQALDWTATDAYAIKFSTSKAEGSFRGLKGTISFDPSDPGASNFDVWVETATISTGNSTKDKHARGDNWLDAAKHPRISFKSSSFVKGATSYTVSGAFTIRGISKAVTIPFTFNDNIFSGEVTINRQDFGVEGPFLFGGLVGDEILVSLRIPVRGEE